MRLFFQIAIILAACACAPAAGDMKIELPVPEELATQSARRAAGEADVPTPILVLEGFEWHGATLRLRVLGPAAKEPAPVLAITGLTGSSRTPSDAPVRKMDLVIPLNARSVEILAGKKSVTLTLSPDKGQASPLIFRRAYFRTAR
jgi:hypothetical protein